MSNQIQITGGAKVRSLEGVITGTSGVLSSVPLGAANGVATLDAGGKVPVSQLPSSVVTYLGTWNAATNTPTLVNGTGDAGDLYLCNVAGTVNFGAGPIVFVIGDWVLYGSGTWQKSNGQNGTVTSVAATITGGAIGITGSPITTAGTLAFAFAGTSLQYVNGAGDLTTFPSLTGYIPYTGATSSIDLNNQSVVNISHLGINTTTVPTILLRAVGDNNSGSRIAMRGYSSNANSSSIRVTKFRGTAGSPQAPLSGDSLGKFELAGYGTTSSDGYPQASFEGLATENWTATARGSKTVIKITPNTTITQAIALTINQDKSAVFENSVTGTSFIKTGGTSSQFLKADGSVDSTSYITLTSLSFAAGSGAYNNTTGVITIPTNNTQITNGANYITLTSLSAGTGISYSNTTGVITSTITQYTNALAIAAPLTGYVSGAGVISATDSILSAIQKLNGNIGALTTGVSSVFGRTGAVVATSGDYTTTQVTEGTNLYYTDVRARASNSFVAGSGAYNSTTGVITIPTNNNQITNGSAYITLGSLSATSPIFYDNTTGIISSQAASASVAGYVTTGTQTIAGAKTFSSAAIFSSTINSVGSIVASGTGNVTLGAYSSDNFPVFQLVDSRSGGKNWNIENGREGAGILGFYQSTTGTTTFRITQSGAGTFAASVTAPSIIKTGGTSSQFLKADGSVDSTAYGTGTVTSVGVTVPLTGGPITSTGTISITQATTSTDGYLSSTDWNTFNNKAASGTYLPLTGGSLSGNLIITGSTNEALKINAVEPLIGIYATGASNTAGIAIYPTTGYDAAIGNYRGGSLNLMANSTKIVQINPSGYNLDVTGTGRFTGALSGTSASFSAFINSTGTASNTIGVGPYLSLINNSNGYQIVQQLNASYGLDFWAYNGSFNKIATLSNTGAATFSSSVTMASGSSIIGSGNGLKIGYDNLGGGMYFADGNNLTTFKNWRIGTSLVVGGDLTFTPSTTNGGTTFSTPSLTILSTGAATFSSTVTVNELKLTGNAAIQNITTGGYIAIYGNTGGLYLGAYNAGANQNYLTIAASTGAATFSSLGTGTVTATSGTLSTVSDMNLKDEDGFIDNALKKVLKLKPRYFHWKEESGLPTDLRQLGFYAQEVNEALGEEAANTPKTEKDKWGIYDRGMIAFLTAAIQEQQSQIEELKQQVQSLLNK